MNKAHYPISSKFFKTKLVTLFQHYGAKIHINYIPVPPNMQQQNPDEPESMSKKYLRYMIVEHSDLIRDLNYWETLSISSLMLRPVSFNMRLLKS